MRILQCSIFISTERKSAMASTILLTLPLVLVPALVILTYLMSRER